MLRDLSLAAGLVLASGCTPRTQEVRPDSVPAEALFVDGGKSGAWWQLCRLANAGDTVYCRIWSGTGLISYDDQFLPADGGATPTLEELKIISDPTLSGRDRIVLANHRVLLPKSRFEVVKKAVHTQTGKPAGTR